MNNNIVSESKITYNDLSTPLKILVVLGWVGSFFMAMFIILWLVAMVAYL
jgi:hypothetical protein